MQLEQIARVCHEVNKVYSESIGDYSQPYWEDVPQWQKDSIIDGIKFQQSNPYSTPADNHNNWMAYKVKEGWVYGKIKNPSTKEHPCLVLYSKLSPEQKLKDTLFITIVKSFIDE